MAAPALTQYVQGVGQVSADGLNTMEQTCDTFAQLRTLVGLPGMQVFARGGVSIADGLQGVFYWQASNAGPDNASTVIVPTGALLGAWVKLALVTNSAFPLGQCRLSFNSTTQIQLNPYNGNSIQIQGAVFSVPSGGITAGNTGVFINGASGQNLVASTLYYVYVFSNSGTPTLDFSTTAYSQDVTAGNVGVYMKNGTPSRSLVGMTYVDGTSLFHDSATQRNTASWFNRQLKLIQGATTNSTTTASAALVELNTAARVEAAAWADDPSISMSTLGFFFGNTAGNTETIAIWRDGATIISVAMTQAVNNYNQNAAIPWVDSTTEGRHLYTIAASTSANNLTVNAQLVGFVRN